MSKQRTYLERRRRKGQAQSRPFAITPARQQSLLDEAALYHQRLAQFLQRQYLADDCYFLISTMWLDKWKRYVSYEQYEKGKERSEMFGEGRLPLINQDLVQSNNFTFYFQDEWSYLNCKLRPNLKMGVHYEIIDYDLWRTFKSYGGQEIRRMVRRDEKTNKRHLQVYFKPIITIPISLNVIKDIAFERIRRFEVIQFQIPRDATVAQIINKTQALFAALLKKQNFSIFPNSGFSRFWSIQNDDVQPFLKQLELHHRRYFPSFIPGFQLVGKLLRQNQIGSQYNKGNLKTLIVELRQMAQDWHFVQAPNRKVSQIVEKYSSKGSQKSLSSGLSWLKQQANFHQNSVNVVAESRIGLKNIGNTCYMNAALQCLIHLDELSSFLISLPNSQGNGILMHEYINLLKEMEGTVNDVISPVVFKRCLDRIHPNFAGTDQHDSEEFLSFLLGNLHLSLIKNKSRSSPFSNWLENKSEDLEGEKAWQTFKKANNSFIVNMLYGQYRSVLNCSKKTCLKASVIYEPFLICNLSISDMENDTLDLTFVHQQVFSSKIQLKFDAKNSPTLNDSLPKLRRIVGSQNGVQFLFYCQQAHFQASERISTSLSLSQIHRRYKNKTIYVRQMYRNQSLEDFIQIVVTSVGTTGSIHQLAKKPKLKAILNSQGDFWASSCIDKLWLNLSSENTTCISQIKQQIFLIPSYLTNREIYCQILNYYSALNIIQGDVSKIIKDSNSPQLDHCQILLLSPSRDFCDYCGRKGCSGCLLPLNDRHFFEYITANPKSKFLRRRRVQIQLRWEKRESEMADLFISLEQQEAKVLNRVQAPANSTKNSLQQCLDQFKGVEELEQTSEWICTRCKSSVQAQKKIEIILAPKLLIFCLKRFGGDKDKKIGKIDRQILIPHEGLDLSKYVVNKKSPLLYDLVSFISHKGSIDSGHYIAYCKLDNQSWWEFNDEAVEPIETANIHTANAYILFYRRREQCVKLESSI